MTGPCTGHRIASGRALITKGMLTVQTLQLSHTTLGATMLHTNCVGTDPSLRRIVQALQTSSCIRSIN